MKTRPTLRAKITAGEPTVGTHFMLVDPDIPEMIGDSGLFDYGEFCAEYAMFDMPTLSHFARAGQAGNLPLIIKPDQANQEFWAQVALGAGFEGVLFTDIRTPEDVVVACRSVRPDVPASGGHMGVKLRRAALGSYDAEQYLRELEEVVIAIMIEKDAAVRDLDAILEVARDVRVSMTQWGPADFGFSRGQPGLMLTPEIRAFEEQVIAKSLEYGLHPRIELNRPEDAARYVDLGVRHFCIGWDRFIYRAALLQLGEGMREIIDHI